MMRNRGVRAHHLGWPGLKGWTSASFPYTSAVSVLGLPYTSSGAYLSCSHLNCECEKGLWRLTPCIYSSGRGRPEREDGFPEITQLVTVKAGQ